MATGLVILAIFLVAAVLMFLRLLPAMLALPAMAVAIAGIEVIAGRLAVEDLTRAVVADGAVRLSEAMVTVMLGGVLSSLMQKAGVAESIVHKGAELSGDNPWTVTVAMLAVSTLLFTTVSGLGPVIMLGTIVLPILASMGVREHVSSGVLLFGISLGGLLNAANWTMYRSVLGVAQGEVSAYATMLFGVAAAVSLGFVTVELWRARAVRVRARSLARAGAAALGMALPAWGLLQVGHAYIDFAMVGRSFAAALGTLLCAGVVHHLATASGRGRVHWSAYGIPVVPLLLILAFEVPFVAAFLCGIAYAMAATYRRGILNHTSRAIIDGAASVAPAVALMMGIGMLLSAILGPTAGGAGQYWLATHAPGSWPVLADMKPVVQAITPTSWLGYVGVFTALGPLALYRGPLNVWGLGYGVGGVLLATGVPAGAVMGLLMSLGMIQGVSDPTNTANVWLANEVRLDVTTLMWRTLPYAWAIASLGLVVAASRFWG